jgi:hypothetical protein
VIYISPVGTVDTRDIKSCSYLSPKAALPRLGPAIVKKSISPVASVGSMSSRKLPSAGRMERKWDCGRRSSSVKRTRRAPSSRCASCSEAAVLEGEQDAPHGWSDDEYDSGLIVDGIVKETLTAMQLRVKQLLDDHQDKILRSILELPCLAPGTGKTTTMIKRLRRTVDVRHLDEAEREVVLESESGLDHPVNWIMFTPNELLRLQIKDALGNQVPLDKCLYSWDDYRFEIAKRPLSLLAGASRRGLVLKADAGVLQADTLTNQIAWFEAFDAFQREDFVNQLAVEADRLAASQDARQALVGRQVKGAIDRSAERVVVLVSELAGRSAELREIAAGIGQESRVDLQRPLDTFARSPGF